MIQKIRQWLEHLSGGPRGGCLPVRALALGLGLTLAPHTVSAAERGPDLPPTVGSIERLDPRLDALVPPEAVIEVLGMGHAWAEGPVWVKEQGHLLFSDIPHNRVHRWKEGEGVSLFLEPSGFTGPAEYGKERGSNGLTLDRK